MATIGAVEPAQSSTGAGIAAGIIDAAGSSPRVGRISPEARTFGSTLVCVVAAPLNPLDLAIASGTFHSVRHDAAYVPGVDCVGTVLRSDSFAHGTWVYAECRPAPDAHCALASQVVVPDESLLVLPDGLEPVLAAAVGNGRTAAYLSLVEDAGLRDGDTVLVLGATGAVGQLAIPVAHLRGAGRVVGVARDVAALERLHDLGANAVIDLRPDEDVEGLAFRMLVAAGPVDVVLDGIYGCPFEPALRACASRARIVNSGNAAGATAQVSPGLLRGNQLRLSGFAGLHTPMEEKRDALTWLWRAIAAGELQLETRTFALDDLPDAWLAQAASPHGKGVVLPGGDPPARTASPQAHATYESEK